MTYPPLIPGFRKILHGGDYNPEQWPQEIWAEDEAAMADVKWNTVSAGIFSWVSFEPIEGQYIWDWLDQVFERQTRMGGKVNLATPSAATPAWLSRKHPEVLRCGPDRVRRKQGNRVNFCWTSPTYRSYVHRASEQLAARYGNHPSLGMWHISNEYGGECFCDLCVAQFREWLRRRHQSLDQLNQAYWTPFWGHTFTDWDEIDAPGEPYGEMAIPGLQLDWRRFTSDQIVDFFINESEPCRRLSPHIPVTTNLMGFYPGFDPFALAPHFDFAAWDSYPFFVSAPFREEAWVANAMSHDMNRSLKQGRPFLLMEHSPSSTNWLQTMTLMRPGVLRLQAVQALAHGADGIQYFQWRQGRGGSEHSHGAVMAHSNRRDTKVYQEVKQTGALLEHLPDLVGAATSSSVAVIYDWEVNWCIEAEFFRRAGVIAYTDTVRAYYKPFWKASVPVDVINSAAELGGYRIVVAPVLVMLQPSQAERLAKFVEEGGHLVLTYHSAMFDRDGLNFLGGFPQPLRSVLGIWSEEVDHLYPSQTNCIRLGDGRVFATGPLCERIHCDTARVLGTYTDQFYAGEPALTVNSFGRGQAYYVAASMEPAFLDAFLNGLCDELGLLRQARPDAVSLRVRETDHDRFVFLMNCSDHAVTCPTPEPNLTDAETGDAAPTTLHLPPFGSKILRRARD